jgi:hypothetical protein
MPTYTSNNRWLKIDTGDEDGTWGDSTNDTFDFMDQALGFVSHANADSDETITISDDAASDARYMVVKVTGTLTADRTITVGPNTTKKAWFFINATTGGYNILIRQGTGGSVTIPSSHSAMVYGDGAGAAAQVFNVLDNLSLTKVTATDLVAATLTASGNVTISGTTTMNSNLSVTGNISGTGNLTGVSIAAALIDSGTVATARLGSGTANSGSFLRGDQTWAAITANELVDLTDVNSSTPTNGNLLFADGANWESRAFVATDISSGTIESARMTGSYTGITALGTLTSLTVSGTLAGTTVTATTVTTSGSSFQEPISAKDSGLAHGIGANDPYGTPETDDFFIVRRGTSQRNSIMSYTNYDANNAFQISSFGGTADTTKNRGSLISDGSGALISLYATETTVGGALSAVTANGNVMRVAMHNVSDDYERTLFIVDEDGDFHYDGADGGAFDAYEDAQLVRAFALATSEPKQLVKDEFDEFVRYNEDDLVRVGVLGDTVANGGMVNGAQLQRLHTGAIWQMFTRAKSLEMALHALIEKNPDLIGVDEVMELMPKS